MPPSDFAPAALQALADDIGDDGVAEMLEVFLQETNARLRRMAAADASSAALLREAHTLKGAASTVCAPLLHQRAEALENRLRAGGTILPADLAALSEAFDAFIQAIEAADMMPRVAA